MADKEMMQLIARATAEEVVGKAKDSIENICYDVGRKLQEESHEQFCTVFRHVLNVDPKDPAAVKKFQKVMNYAEDKMDNSDADRKTLRAGFLTAIVGWVTTVVVALYRSRSGSAADGP